MPEADAQPRTATQGDGGARGPVRRYLLRWRGAGRPDLEAFLREEGPLDPAELAAVLRADQRKRWRAGVGPLAEWYIERFPALSADPELGLDLIHAEFVIRESLGESPDLAEYVGRFPDLAGPIGVQVAFHRALEAVAESGARGRPDRGRPPEEARDGLHEGRLAIPGYEIVRELGAGGMAVVYEAYQIGLKRRVALKMGLDGHRIDDERLARFQIEAEASASLHHPNIVEIYDIGEAGGRPYFSMELVEGGTLAQELAGGPASARRAAQVTETLSRAMHYAHERGIIHRDLKPANVLLGPGGAPKIADFGLAKCLGRDSGQTQSGTILGSPCYMSPEQASGSVHEAGPASDVYSLGAILYEMLAGGPPFRSETPLDTLRKLLNEEPERPTLSRPKVPRDLETICLKCLEKDPGRRYASALELAEDLGRFLDFESIRARPVRAHERLWRWCRRKTALAVASALAAVAALTAIGLVVFLAVYHYQAAARIGQALNEVRARGWKVDQMAAQLAYDRGQAACEQGDAAQGVLWLVRGLKSAGQAQDPFLAHAFRRGLRAWLRKIHPLRVRVEHTAPIHAVAVSPDGRTIAAGGEDGTLWLWDASTGGPVASGFAHPAKVTSLAFSPDGRCLLTGCEDSIARVWDIEAGTQVGPTFAHTASILAVAFGRDGRAVLTGSTDNTARIWDAKTGAPIGAPMRHGGFVDAVAFSPDGLAVATGSWDRTARLWDAKTGGPIGEPISHDDWVSSVAFSPDGKTILTGSYDRTARLWGRDDRRPVGGPFPHQHCVGAVAFGPDGGTILTGCYDGTARLWEVEGCKPLGTLLRHQHTVSSVAFSPDGRTVLTGSYDRTARLWEVARTPGLAFAHSGFIRAVIFSPDGRTILTASEDRTARLWDARTGGPIGPPLEHEGSVEAVAFSPAGTRALTGSFDGTARLWDAATGRPAAPPLRHGDRVKAVAFRPPQGDVVATGSDDGTARLWDAKTGLPAGPPLRHEGRVLTVAFSPDGRLLLTGSEDGTARLWDANTGAALGEPLRHGGRVAAAAFNPIDGKLFVTGSDDTKARLWDTESRKLLGRPLQHDGPVSVAAFSPDGQIVITGGWDRVARLWESRTGRPVSAPLRHEGTLRALAVARDGRNIVTGSYDRTAQLWDKVTGKPIGPAFRHENQVWFVAFSPDGRFVLTGGQEKKAHLWEIPPIINAAVEDLDNSTQVATGLQLQDDGSLHILDALEWNERRTRRHDVLGTQAAD